MISIFHTEEPLTPIELEAEQVRKEGKYLRVQIARLTELSLLLLAVLSYQPAEAYPLKGLLDLQGRTILPCEYKEITSCGSGIYLCEKINQKDPSSPSFNCLLMTADGKQIALTLPAGHTLSKLYLPLTQDRMKPLTVLPAGTYLEVHSENGFGICDQSGKLLIPAVHRSLSAPNGDYYIAVDLSGLDKPYFINAITGAKRSIPSDITFRQFSNNHKDEDPILCKNSKGLWGYLKRGGDIAIEPQFVQAFEFAPIGLASVKLDLSKSEDPEERAWVYIDKTGKVVSPRFEMTLGFVGDYAVVREGKDKQFQFGLIDKTFNYKLPPIYRSIAAIAPGLYAASKTKEDIMQATDAKGKVIFNFPEGTVNVAVSQRGLIASVPSATDQYYLLDYSGNVLGQYKEYPALKEFDLKRNYKNDEFNRKVISIESRDGKVVARATDSDLSILSPDRIAKTIDNGRFSPEIWRAKNRPEFNGVQRLDEFKLLLQNYNLIKMPKTKLESLLGKPDTDDSTYAVTNFYGSIWIDIEFYFSKDQNVEAWRVRWRKPNHEEQMSDWIASDVVLTKTNYLDLSTMGHPLNLIPKSNAPGGWSNFEPGIQYLKMGGKPFQ